MTLLRRSAALPLLASLLSACAGPTPTADPASPGAGAEITASQQLAVSEAERIAPALESYYRGAGYPADLAGAEASLAATGLQLAPGSTLGGYAFDDAATEFTLCVEVDGAWGSYDTAPMSVRSTGAAGGCPTG